MFYLYAICCYKLHKIKNPQSNNKICATWAARTLEHDSTNVMHISFIYWISSFLILFYTLYTKNKKWKDFLCLSSTSSNVILFACMHLELYKYCSLLCKHFSRLYDCWTHECNLLTSQSMNIMRLYARAFYRRLDYMTLLLLLSLLFLALLMLGLYAHWAK